MKRNFEIDKLRAIAIIFVMIVHFPSLKNKIPYLDPWSGVDLFFVISGYIVSKNFLDKLDLIISTHSSKSKNTYLYIKSFLIKRFFRIIPIMLFLSVTYTFLYMLLNKYHFLGTHDLWYEILILCSYGYNFYLSYGGNAALGYHWSLAVEEQFYIIFPLFMIIFRENIKRITACIILILLISFVTRPYCYEIFNHPQEVFYLTQYRADALIYGVLLYLLTKRKSIIEISKILSYKRHILITVSTIFIILIALSPKIFSSPVYSLPIIALSSMHLVFFASLEKNIIIPIKSLDKLLWWIGTRSYGIYLIHIPAVRFMQSMSELIKINFNINTPYFIYFPLTLILIILTAEFCYQNIEKRFIKIGSNFSKKIEIKIFGSVQNEKIKDIFSLENKDKSFIK